jgi:hypothetical protein
VSCLAKAQRAVKAGVMLMDSPAGGSDEHKAAAITQLASGGRTGRSISSTCRQSQ